MGQKIPYGRPDARSPRGALPGDTIAELIPHGCVADFHDGEVIHLRGETGSRLSVVVSGRVSLSSTDAGGRRIEIAKLKAGEFYGVHQALANAPYTHDAEAIGLTRVLSFDNATVERLLDTHKSFRTSLYTFLADRLVKALRMVETERRYSLCVRLAKYLQANRDLDTDTVKGSQASHAEVLGVSRNALGTCLQQLSERGLLSVTREAIRIPSPEQLNEWISQQIAKG